MPIYYKKVEGPGCGGHGEVRFSDQRSGRCSRSLKSRFRRAASQDLSNLDSKFPLISCPRVDQSLDANEEVLETSFGSVLVAHQGADLKAKRPVILTFHDLGLNHVSNFDNFFEFSDNKLLLQSFSVLHVNAPGQERYASTLPDGYVYPTMDQLSILVNEVIEHFHIASVIGLGAGVGANVLLRFALAHPLKVEGLVLINASSEKASWTEWFFQKKNIRAIRSNNRSEDEATCFLFASVVGKMLTQTVTTGLLCFRHPYNSS